MEKKQEKVAFYERSDRLEYYYRKGVEKVRNAIVESLVSDDGAVGNAKQLASFAAGVRNAAYIALNAISGGSYVSVGAVDRDNFQMYFVKDYGEKSGKDGAHWFDSVSKEEIDRESDET